MIITKLFSGIFKIILIVIGTIIIIRLFPDLINYLGFLSHYWKMFLIVLSIDFLFYRYFLKSRIFKGLFKNTIEDIMTNISNRVSVGVVGHVDADKSSLGTLFTQVTEMRNLALLQEEFDNLQLVLGFLNFEELQKFFIQYFDVTHVYTSIDYLRFAWWSLYETEQLSLIYDYDLSINSNDVLLLQYKPFSKSKADELLALYFEDMYYTFIRQTHVLSNTPIESINTGTISLPMKESLIQLYKDNDLAFEKWLVIFEDEKGIIDNSRLSAKIKSDEDEDGKDAYYMILRHLSEGTNCHFNINQRVEDVTAFMRRLYQIVIDSHASQEIMLFDLEYSLLSLFIGIAKNLEKKYRLLALFNGRLQRYFSKELALKTSLRYEDYLLKNNGFKKFQRFTYMFQQKIGKIVFKRNLIGIHYRVDDVGKDIFDPNTKVQSIGLNIIYDVNWVYGKYSTHALKFFRDLRNQKAKTPLSQHIPFKGIVTNEEEYRKMQYKNFDRILDSIGNITSVYGKRLVESKKVGSKNVSASDVNLNW